MIKKPSIPMNAIDLNCKYLGLSPIQLMESAGCRLSIEIKQTIDDLKLNSIIFIAGKGNNGGDAFVAARHLSYYENLEIKVIILTNSSQIKTKESKINYNLLKHCPIKIIEITDSIELNQYNLKTDILIDAIFGTGIKGKVKGIEAIAIDKINDSDSFIISVDVPSGFNTNKSVKSNKIITFHSVKEGFDKLDGVTTVPIGVCKDAETFVGIGNLKNLNIRKKDSHKGNSGRILIIGGGAYTGAPVLSAYAALRAGADIVTLAVPKSIADTVKGFSPNLIVRELSSNRLCQNDIPLIKELIESHSVVIIGMGMGNDSEIGKTINVIIPLCKKIVIDADALLNDYFSKKHNQIKKNKEIIITPHSKEFERISGIKISQDFNKKANQVMEFSKNNGIITLLKGNIDVISDGATIIFNKTGNPGMTVGGTGDVLAGIVGTLFAVNSGFNAASCGAFINGIAGDMAFKTHGFGLVATDVIDNIGKALIYGEN
ncbi:MAG: NAD(P)H-hydrate dehydratase [Methanosarcinaceae archaeon]|nr:NAD(P)H-hydrate dehydratase [Methanosarcinaceae archaeon]